MSTELIKNFLNLVFTAFYYLLIVRVVLSWVPNLRENALVQLIVDLTDPILRPLQRLIPPLGGIIDISPIIAIFLLRFLQSLVNSYL